MYPLALVLHLCLVVASVGLFAARAVGVQLKHAWPMAPLWRRLSMGIDSALLLAGASLWALLQLNPLQAHWLGVKLVLLLVYIGLGTLALKRARSQGAKAVCALAALATVGFMAGVALNHHPMGWWAPGP